MLMMTIFFYTRFFESSRNLTTKHVKIVKIPGFFRGFFSDFCSKFLKFQVFPGKVATLSIEILKQNNSDPIVYIK